MDYSLDKHEKTGPSRFYDIETVLGGRLNSRHGRETHDITVGTQENRSSHHRQISQHKKQITMGTAHSSHPMTSLSVCLSLSVSLSLSLSVSLCLSVWLAVCLSICLSVYLFRDFPNISRTCICFLLFLFSSSLLLFSSLLFIFPNCRKFDS